MILGSLFWSVMKKDDKQSIMKSLSMVTQLGITVIVPALLLTLLGKWLDDKWGTNFIALIGAVLGLAGGMAGCWKLLKGMIPKNETKEEYDLMAEWNEETEEEPHEK